MACFTQRLQGPAAAVSLLRGLLFGSFAFDGFFLVLTAMMERADIGVTFAAAIVTAVIIQVLSLRILRRKKRR